MLFRSFQQQSQSKTIAAHVIGNTTNVGAKVVIIDRGTGSGIQKGMAVITPDGIVGKVTGAYPTASYVLLVTDPSFAAGVLSQKHRVRGTLKGQGYGTVFIDYVDREQKVEQGEWFYTSGDDRIFPKGLPVGEVSVVRAGKTYQQVYVNPSGFQNGLEEVLVIVDGVHGTIPENPPGFQPVHMQDPPPAEVSGEAAPLSSAPPVPQPSAVPARSGPPATDADGVGSFQTKFGADSFVVIEKWRDLPALKAHAAAPHMAAYAAKVKDMLANRVIHVLSPAG